MQLGIVPAQRGSKVLKLLVSGCALSSVALAGVIAVATPVRACKDWRAIAMFDQAQIGVITEMWKRDRARDEILMEAMRWAVIHRDAAMADPCTDEVPVAPAPFPTWPGKE